LATPRTAGRPLLTWYATGKNLHKFSGDEGDAETDPGQRAAMNTMGGGWRQHIVRALPSGLEDRDRP